MDQTIKNKWVKALRSGAYAQIKGNLRTSKGFCCLGVLCDVVDTTRWTSSIYVSHAYGDYVAFFPPVISDASGLSHEDAQILMEANDRHKWTFDEIATYIDIML
jgi:hypothetical protein